MTKHASYAKMFQDQRAFVSLTAKWAELIGSIKRDFNKCKLKQKNGKLFCDLIACYFRINFKKASFGAILKVKMRQNEFDCELKLNRSAFNRIDC